MFQVFTTHPAGYVERSFPLCETVKDDLDSAFDYALIRSVQVVPHCRIWIETETGQILPVMN